MAMYAGITTSTRDSVVEVDPAAAALLNETLRELIEWLGQWALTHAKEFGLQIESIRARRWQSVEDPQWVLVIVDVKVAGPAGNALRFWEAVSEEFGRMADAAAPGALDLLTVHVRWT